MKHYCTQTLESPDRRPDRSAYEVPSISEEFEFETSVLAGCSLKPPPPVDPKCLAGPKYAS